MRRCAMPPARCPGCGGDANTISPDRHVSPCGCDLSTPEWEPIGIVPTGHAPADFQAVGVCESGCAACRVSVAWRPQRVVWWVGYCRECDPGVPLVWRRRTQADTWASAHRAVTNHVPCLTRHPGVVDVLAAAHTQPPGCV